LLPPAVQLRFDQAGEESDGQVEAAALQSHALDGAVRITSAQILCMSSYWNPVSDQKHLQLPNSLARHSRYACGFVTEFV
jgi:hypothetical protein